MEYRMREHVTDYLKLQAAALAQLEAILDESESEVLKNKVTQIQHEQVNLQNRFTRLLYLSGEAY